MARVSALKVEPRIQCGDSGPEKPIYATHVGSRPASPIITTTDAHPHGHNGLGVDYVAAWNKNR